ncbi:MAG: lipase maturation factor family protein [Turneriella sp.]|nr:lipase maturation factor family protein [Turneriella sp.]
MAFRRLRAALVLVWLFSLLSAAVQIKGLSKIAVAPPVAVEWRLAAQLILFGPVFGLLWLSRAPATEIFTDGLLALFAIAYAHFPAPFFDYIWDVFLIETTYVFLLSRALLFFRHAQKYALEAWPLRLLLFKLMFSMGVIKFFRGMPEWRDGTALLYFWANQPMPAWPAWYAAQLPLFWQKLFCLFVFLAEIPGPFLVFCGRHARMLYFFMVVLLQAGIAVTGNYGIFNLLTVVLALSLWEPRSEEKIPQPKSLPQKNFITTWAMATLCGWLLCSLWYQAAVFFVSTRQLPETSWIFLDNPEQRALWPPLRLLLKGYAAAKTANPYALFGHISKYRMEMAIWANCDGGLWKKYRFRVKPDDPRRAPVWYAPHHWRLDHQMYYESFRIRAPQLTAQYSFFLGARWWHRFLEALFSNDPDATALLAENPCADRPLQLRLEYAYYRFTNAEEFAITGHYWKTEPPHAGQFFEQPFTASEIGRMP